MSPRFAGEISKLSLHFALPQCILYFYFSGRKGFTILRGGEEDCTVNAYITLQLDKVYLKLQRGNNFVSDGTICTTFCSTQPKKKISTHFTHCGHVLSFSNYCAPIQNKGIRDAGSTEDIRMLWSAIVCLGLGLL